jgi:hypothetical protein
VEIGVNRLRTSAGDLILEIIFIVIGYKGKREYESINEN